MEPPPGLGIHWYISCATVRAGALELEQSGVFDRIPAAQLARVTHRQPTVRGHLFRADLCSNARPPIFDDLKRRYQEFLISTSDNLDLTRESILSSFDAEYYRGQIGREISAQWIVHFQPSQRNLDAYVADLEREIELARASAAAIEAATQRIAASSAFDARFYEGGPSAHVMGTPRDYVASSSKGLVRRTPYAGFSDSLWRNRVGPGAAGASTGCATKPTFIM